MTAQDRNRSILEHILKYCDQIDAAVVRFGHDQRTFEGDTVYQNAVAMCLLQIGELVGHLSEDFRIPTRKCRGGRSRRCATSSPTTTRP